MSVSSPPSVRVADADRSALSAEPSPRGALSALQPYVRNPEQAGQLTREWLEPVLDDLYAFFLHVRRQVDPELRQRQPLKLGKPYPMGQCLEITQAVEQRLRQLRPDALPEAERRGYDALAGFFAAGGQMRRVWGDLRGKFFQNAFVVGALYVDVSNDTVTPTKPKVEILPFEASGMSPVADYFHFARLAREYWHADVHANLVLPGVAPFCPAVTVNPFGVVRLQAAMHSMVAMTRAGAFEPSEAFLRQESMPEPLFQVVRAALKGVGFALPDTLAEGRKQALDNCRQYRARRWHRANDAMSRAIRMVASANKVLENVRYLPFNDARAAALKLPLAFRVDTGEKRLQLVALQALPVQKGTVDGWVPRCVPAGTTDDECVWPLPPGICVSVLERLPLPDGSDFWKASSAAMARVPGRGLRTLADAGLLEALHLQVLSMQHLKSSPMV